MIEVATAWNIVRNEALKLLRLEMSYNSIRNGVEYQILQVAHNNIVIQRNGDPVVLSQGDVEGAIQRLNDNNGAPLHYSEFLHTVAKETTLVLFHPELTWTDEGTHIVRKSI